MADGIYSPKIILKALAIERDYYKSLGLEGKDEQAPNLVFFKIENGTIIDIIYIPRNEFKNYNSIPEKDAYYYLDMTRDSGIDVIDYNLEPVSKLYDLWFPKTKTEEKEVTSVGKPKIEALLKAERGSKNNNNKNVLYNESICTRINRLLSEALNESSIFKAPTLEQFLDICGKANIQIDLDETDNAVAKIDYPIDNVDIYTIDYETCILDSYSYDQLLNKLVDTLKLELGDYIGDSIDKEYLLQSMRKEQTCRDEVIDKLNENRKDYNRIYKFEYITEVQGEQTKYIVIKMIDL